MNNNMTHNNKENSLEFEHYCIDLHQKKYNQVTYHWNNIPTLFINKKTHCVRQTMFASMNLIHALRSKSRREWV